MIMWPASRQSDAALRQEGGRLGKQTYGAGLLSSKLGEWGLHSSRCIIKWKLLLRVYLQSNHDDCLRMRIFLSTHLT